MTTKHYQPGEVIFVGKQTYMAITPLKKGDCLGCDFKQHNGDYNECHAPDNAGCKDCIFKKQLPSELIVEEIDIPGCRTGIIILSTAIGAIMAALSTAIYYHLK